MALKFLACTIRPLKPSFADLILELWCEFEAGETRTSQLVRQIDKLECIDQAIIYEERSGVNLGNFMALEEQITLPELKSWKKIRLQDYENLKSRKKAPITVVFVSGGPGVGKGTQCARVAKEFDFCHISVGDLLREEAKSPTSPYRDFIPESIQKSICDRNSTISLDCSEEEMRRRLERRAESSERIDDNPDTVLKRLKTFKENNAPVIEHLEKRESVYQVDCSRSIDEVYSSVRSSIRHILQKK
ncbi:MAG: hypothetical protein Q9204_003662 [Flavoplaca sp. TL-2023a]